MRHQTICALKKSSRGFTLVELVVVVTIVLVLSALALPSFSQWYQNAAYRNTARNIMSELRQAKSQAVEKNVAQQVQFDAGSQSYGSSDVGSAITNMTKLDLASQVTISPTTNIIQFTPMGLASTGTGTVYILDSSGKQRFFVQVDPTGRIFVKGPL